MKKKTAHKNHHKQKKTKSRNSGSTFISIHYIFIGVVIVLVGLAGLAYAHTQNSGGVLGASVYFADKNSGDGADQASSNSTDNSSSSTDTNSTVGEKSQPVEPKNLPEIKQQVEQIQNEVKNQVEKNQLQSIEVKPPQEGSPSGVVILHQNNDVSRQVGLTASQTASLTEINTPQAGAVSVQIGNANSVTITNGPYTITTQFPVVVDPTTQTMAIRTPSGVTVIKTFPAQALQSLPPQNKLNSVTSINLTAQQGTPVYQTTGIQIRKFLGLFPITGKVSEQINAQTGQVTMTNMPWYFSVLNFAFQSPQTT